MQTSDKTPILFLDNTYTFGGAINSLLYLLRALDKSRFTPVLVTAQPVEFLHQHFGFMKWQHVAIKLPWVHNRIYKKITSYILFSSGFGLKCVNRIRFLYWLLFVTLPEAIRYYRIGRKNKVCLVHLNNILGGQLAGIWAAKMLGVPCVAHLRDFEEVDGVTKFYAKFIDSHIAISGAIKDNLLRLKIPEEKIDTIYDAIDLDDFNDQLSCDYLRQEFDVMNEGKLFGIFGRIIEWKGIKEFVHAAAIVIQSVPTAKAFVVGDCSDGEDGYLEEVRELIARYGLEQQIILTGYRKDIAALMGVMDVVVHASITPEPFGMVLIEGMAMAKPVVATRMGGPLDIVVDNETGFLVEPGNVVEMANAIHRLLSEKSLAAAMGASGKNRVATMFAKERYAQQVEEIYMRILHLA
ncbi:MAG: glycosyltransferase family 4 protein [Desulfocapsa sp.]|uniref:Glycosyltransferase family 4 protein n=1 Tax=Desulfotalea psychrophila TaxID=84980 RepID=A0ABS3ATF2_9BACT|nr:glycosyltransferase family 4 protein [Desulfocapsa sp.]MBN4068394.1 glycosyltransferase family 4 protein [Desulfotalea psychrophila]